MTQVSSGDPFLDGIFLSSAPPPPPPPVAPPTLSSDPAVPDGVIVSVRYEPTTLSGSPAPVRYEPTTRYELGGEPVEKRRPAPHPSGVIARATSAPSHGSLAEEPESTDGFVDRMASGWQGWISLLLTIALVLVLRPAEWTGPAVLVSLVAVFVCRFAGELIVKLVAGFLPRPIAMHATIASTVSLLFGVLAASVGFDSLIG
jgi:hypothetical protein